jgi:heme exporter protein D
MNWGSAAEFLAMGGYGFFVWGSFAVTAACLVAEPLLVRARMRRALAQARAQAGGHEAAA